jgi:hypothetical protein
VGLIDRNLTESVVASHGKSGLLAIPYPELTLFSTDQARIPSKRNGLKADNLLNKR